MKSTKVTSSYYERQFHVSTWRDFSAITIRANGEADDIND